MIDFNNKKIAVIGLGYVGLPLAIEFGKKRSVVGFDLNDLRISELKKSIDVTKEVHKNEFANSSFIEFTSDSERLMDCGIYIITVPTPIDGANRPNLEPLKKATAQVAEYLNKGDTVIYESTVFPGCTDEVCIPILESLSNLKYNEDFFCGYSPERINPGDKINTLTTIKKITSGSNKESSIAIDHLYNQIIDAGTFMATSIKVAEAAKVIENTQRDLNIALVNELSVIFERLDIDTNEVLEAAASKWNFLPFKPGIVGGHCIGVDPYYLTHKAEQVGYNPQVILAGRRINDNMAKYAAKSLIKRMLQNNIDVSKSTVGVLGITFKDDCPDIRNSKVIDLINELKQWNVKVVVSDPWADPSQVKHEYGIELTELDCNSKFDSIIVAVGHSDYLKYSIPDLKALCLGNNPVLADLKGIFNKDEAIQNGFTVFRL